ncbi:MAG TPA: hypothetical protein VI382_03615 [Candidatus Manganitrophaceae bacterium]|nr:hypothetical protein [Candidatus Manganitrophaceae bacterium]
MEDRPEERRGPFLRPLGRFQLFKLGMIALFGLSIAIAFFLAAFFIGLILAIPLALVLILWRLRIAWRSGRGSRIDYF